MKKPILITSSLTLTVLAACGVRSTAPDREGLGDSTETEIMRGSGDAGSRGMADGGSDAESLTPPTPKTRGFYVFTNNYDGASSVGAVALDGTVLSQSLISSGSELPGLSLGLGTDIVPPNQIQPGNNVVIIDRSNNAVDWLSLDEAEVVAQVGVGPGGFAANPYDYLALDDELAFISRFETNRAPGKADFDEGGDLLVINPKTKALVGRVDFNYLVDRDSDLQPRPTKLAEYGGKIHVVLGMLTDGFSAPTESLLATVDPNTLEVTATLGLGMKNCEDFSIAPTGGLAAIACKGDWADDPLTENSGIVTVDLTAEDPKLVDTYGAAALADAQLNTLAFASASLILFSSFGDFDTEANDRALVLDLASGDVSNAGLETSPYQMGHIRCVPDNGVCVIANADEFAVEFLVVTDEGVEHSKSVELGAELGLPPRYIGVF